MSSSTTEPKSPLSTLAWYSADAVLGSAVDCVSSSSGIIAFTGLESSIWENFRCKKVSTTKQRLRTVIRHLGKNKIFTRESNALLSCLLHKVLVANFGPRPTHFLIQAELDIVGLEVLGKARMVRVGVEILRRRKEYGLHDKGVCLAMVESPLGSGLRTCMTIDSVTSHKAVFASGHGSVTGMTKSVAFTIHSSMRIAVVAWAGTGTIAQSPLRRAVLIATDCA